MKFMSFAILFAFLSAGKLGGAQNSAYAVLGGDVPIEIIEAPKDVRVLHRTWGAEAARKNSVRIYAPVSDGEWRRVAVKLKVPADCKSVLSFGGDGEKSPSGRPRNAAFFDNVSIDSLPLYNGDFEKGNDSWSVESGGNFPAKIGAYPRAEGAAHGVFAARASSFGAVRRSVSLKGGRVFELAFDVLGAKPSDLETDFPIDLKKFANTSPSDFAQMRKLPKGAMLGAFLEKLSDSAGVSEVCGIKFDIANSAANSGKLVVALKSSAAPSAPASVKTGGISRSGRYIYVVHALANPDRMQKGWSFGALNIEYTDGVKKGFRMRYGIDADAYRAANRTLRNGRIAFPSDGGALYMSRFPLDANRRVEKVSFSAYGNAPWIVVAATISDKKVDPCETTTPKGNPDWVLADIPEDHPVRAGSALDLSSFLPDAEAGVFGRVIISPRGTMAFEKNPDADVRFKGYTFYPHSLVLKYDFETARDNMRKYAAQIRRNGYNLLRINFDYLKSDTKRAERAYRYDEIDYLIRELKRNGVYIHLPLAWYDIGTKNYSFPQRNDVKIRAIFGEPEARAMWRETAEEQLNHVNPYTNLAWKDDPVFQLFEYYNELSICHNKFDEFSPATQKLLTDRWRVWLEKRYGTVGKLNDAWRGKAWAKRGGYPLKSFADAQCLTAGADWGRFCREAESEFADFCKMVVRGTGYKGIVSQRNLGRAVYDSWARGGFSENVIVNSYYEHPGGLYTPDADHTCNQESSIARSAGYWRAIALSKHADRPLSVTEYNHCYWNKHRFEMMSVFAPYSAFQNFSTLIIHANAVPWRGGWKSRLSPFNVADSPAIRAAELFNQCFFMRGDVKPSEHRVDMLIGKNFVEKEDRALSSVGGGQGHIPLIVGFAVKSDAPVPANLKSSNPKPADMQILPEGAAEIVTEGWAQRVVESGDGSFDLSKFVAEAKRRGMLSPDNESDPAAGVYQTDTRQITMDAKRGSMKVATDKSCAITVHGNTAATAGALRLLSTTVSASVGLASLDGAEIGKSSRLVFVYATQENNIDAITSLDGILSLNEGRGPVAVRRGRVCAELKLDPSKKFSVYALALNGERRGKVSAEFSGGALKLDIDNGAFANGAPTFFEIVSE